MSRRKPFIPTAKELKEAGLPESLAEYGDMLPKSVKTDWTEPLLRRLRRFFDYYINNPDDDTMQRDWRTIERHSLSSGQLKTMFMLFPDKPDIQPFSILYGRRNAEPVQEKERYDEYLQHVIAIEELLSPHGRLYERMLRDASAGPIEAIKASYELAEISCHLDDGLRKLRTLLKAIDPSAKYLTSHWGESGALTTYIALVADLNRYLNKPKHAALARLANINCPDYPIATEAVRKAWKRNTDKTS